MQAQNAESLPEETAVHLTKNRIAAVDIARILAAFAVMYAHIGILRVGTHNLMASLCLLPVRTFGNGSTIFFVFAGYFACRNITWKKALDNAWWSFAPFLLWNIITFSILYKAFPLFDAGYGSVWEYIIKWLGLASLVTPGSGSIPMDGPLWFMRDLVFLFLLSPLIYRWIKWFFPLLILINCTPHMEEYFIHSPLTTMSPYSLTFFALGCYLRSFSKETQQKVLQFHSPTLILIFISLGLASYIYGRFQDYCETDIMRVWTLIPAVIGLWFFYQVARWIEVSFPRVTKVFVKFAPVTFLTFASHSAICMICATHPFSNTPLFLLVPPLIFAAMSVLFFAMKRWCRPLLHLVAHYKLRPDDIKK